MGGTGSGRKARKTLTIDGETRLVVDWVRDAELHTSTFAGRIARGVTGRALLAPVRPRRQLVTYPVDGLPLPLAEAAARLGTTPDALRRRERARVAYRKRVKEGMCVRPGCPALAAPPSPYCDACRAALTVRTRQAKRDARARGAAIGAVA